MIKNWDDFCVGLEDAGFSIFGGNDEGVFGLIGFDWLNESPDSPIRWHTGDPETDPWQWRIRVLTERDDIAYGKVFFRKGGFITRKWYPYFLAARQNGDSFADAYEDGHISHFAKRVYETLSAYGALPTHQIKVYGSFGRNEQSRFEKALVDLQMGLYITICGQAQKRNRHGEEYGWSSMVYCLTEQFWPAGVFDEAAGIGADEAEAAIWEQVLRLNPDADETKLHKFIYG
ncbi:MAG: hypothetical protein FWH01_13575 [Oscillospiraceae bacterium]|nr:hypothetical protein [Oscillospiraceae bacterium]